MMSGAGPDWFPGILQRSEHSFVAWSKHCFIAMTRQHRRRLQASTSSTAQQCDHAARVRLTRVVSVISPITDAQHVLLPISIDVGDEQLVGKFSGNEVGLLIVTLFNRWLGVIRRAVSLTSRLTGIMSTPSRELHQR